MIMLESCQAVKRWSIPKTEVLGFRYLFPLILRRVSWPRILCKCSPHCSTETGDDSGIVFEPQLIKPVISLTATKAFMHESAHHQECLAQCDPENSLVRKIQKHYCSHFTVQEKSEAEKVTFPKTKGNTK